MERAQMYYRLLKWIGIDRATDKCGLSTFIGIGLITILQINCLHSLVGNWGSLDRRIQGLNTFFLYTMNEVLILTYIVKWRASISLIRIIERGFYKVPYLLTPSRLEVVRSGEDDMTKLQKKWFYALTGQFAIVLVTPIAIFLIRLLQYNMKDITIDMLHLHMPFHFPGNYKTVPIYCMAYTIQTVYFFYGLTAGYVVIASSINSLQMVQSELKLLQLSFEEMDEYVGASGNKFHDSGNIYRARESDQFDFVYALKHFQHYVLQHHNYINRYLDIVPLSECYLGQRVTSRKGSNLQPSQAITFMCTSIYAITTKGQLIRKVKEAIHCSLMIFLIYCYSLAGENISTEAKNLRHALYGSTWISKPNWFKKSLLIMMTRTSKITEINAMGLFVLKQENFLLIVKAAYSYYNVLRNFNN